jgi:YHS domain-containing protein
MVFMERLDLVCGMTVEEEQPRFTSDYNHETYAFCSAECRRKFDDHPDHFIREHQHQREDTLR